MEKRNVLRSHSFTLCMTVTGSVTLREEQKLQVEQGAEGNMWFLR
jgi:hypothetical protein